MEKIDVKKYKSMEKFFLENIKTISEKYAVCETSRQKVSIIKSIIKSFMCELIEKNDYNIDPKYVDIVKSNKLISCEHFSLLEENDLKRFNKDYYDLVKNNSMFCEFFDLKEFHDNVVFHYPSGAYHYKEDRDLCSYVRKSLTNPPTKYDCTEIQKEYEIIGELLKFYK